ncbi:hypothetical protein LSTR_LSTR008910 [Laodelphax striatellus]|uniref:ZP domain-containing protein n=1 Tax=Laodelphax striatellus TaxID=195883 RepID=A0A482WMG1_LAOST|nr:hypothetical protein LSTR_LSTR008910 [Laodelphax striatellus]
MQGIASCVYPECVINQDCTRDKACFNQKCRDPCVDACGLNAICQVVNHNAICSCPPGFVGEPRLECRPRPLEIPPRPECSIDDECSNEKACIDGSCKDPCIGPHICAAKAECRVQQHRPFCVCKEGMTGNAQRQCFEIGCRADIECPPQQACVNRECIDPCAYTSCGENAECRVDVTHKARCFCRPQYSGNPLIRCERPQCTANSECPDHLVCLNQRCQDPCDCAPSALCSVANHIPTCRCPPGYVGNPHEACTIAPIEKPAQCKKDADCASKLACFSAECRNPCYETKPCGANAECFVVDTLPLRTMSCLCQPGFVGDADVECKPAPSTSAGCHSDSECPSTDTCLNQRCVNPCALSNPCAKNAECQALNHKAVCRCPPGLLGDPFVNCYKEPLASPECSSDSDCPSLRACVNRRCQDPCIVANPCGLSAECSTSNHRPVCACPQGWAGNPQVQCYKPECKIDADCLYDKACLNGNCISPCISVSCGRGAECRVQAHLAQCVCPQGTQGNPQVSCVSVVCQYNEDCADHEACDRLNRVCRPVCEDDTCAKSATCTARDHQPTCTCPPGSEGNPYIECTRPRTPEITPECSVDAECPSRLACVNNRCENPCRLSAICSPDQECRVQDSLPLRTIMCVCPPDSIATPDGRCKAIAHAQVECKVDSDCRLTDRCMRGSCIEACRVDPCGLNAQCSSISHSAVCTCPADFTGNPHIECSYIPKIDLPLPFAECVRDDDCPDDRGCINQRCEHPCAVSNPCSLSSFCHAEAHKPVCRCPPGFNGDPFTECRPPGAVVGCAANSDCSMEEACINRLCITPCNCGPNADCKVSNHYPTCFCRPGYSGNPQFGCVKVSCEADEQCPSDKTCYNGECVNPCILGDPCVANAECYGGNHRSNCRCRPGYSGNPLLQCEQIECRIDADCPQDRTCLNEKCVNPCVDVANAPCAVNAHCYVRNHNAGCRCPPHAPLGNPLSYCERAPPPDTEPECRHDTDCPSQLACIDNACTNPCVALGPCSASARCSVLDTMPVRTMICTCPEGWVPNSEGECKPIILPMPPGCMADSECSSNETCINRMCRNPCNCGKNAQCFVQDHRPICSCQSGYEGNPQIACRTVGCRSDSECDSGKACINGNCVNPCVINDPCGANAECYVLGNRAECRCLSGYQGNPRDRCLVVGCRSNSDCPEDRACINAQCINPCIYEHPCALRAECQVHNHLALCRCPLGSVGNPYVSCRPEPTPECKVDGDCPPFFGCFNERCREPCNQVQPCDRPAECQAVSSLPVRTMICVCPSGYVSSGSGTCKATPPIEKIGGCVEDGECPSDKACVRGVCRDPCDCGLNAECRVINHKPVCTCRIGYDGNPDIECVKAGCRSDSDCSGQHSCVNRICSPVCASDGSSCGTNAQCYGAHHRAICECAPGLTGDAQVACILVECTANSDCPTDRACVNRQCVSPCAEDNPCKAPAECHAYNHKADCSCPPGYIGDLGLGCEKIEAKCVSDTECPSQTACINAECVNPCPLSQPCGNNTICQVFDTTPVRTMICECLPGYQGNAAIKCDNSCPFEKGFIRDDDGNCICPPGTGLSPSDECVRCLPERGQKIDERGNCVCALERGMIIDERGNCRCPTEHGYRLDFHGNCVPVISVECESNDECPDHRYCNLETKTCDDPCAIKRCGVNALCNATGHQAICACITGYYGDANVYCNTTTSHLRTDFPKPEMAVSCLSDGVQVEVHITEQGFNGVLYVKGHSKNEQCRRVVTLPPDSTPRNEIFKVNFGSCGLIQVNGQATFVLVIQKHPKLVTYKAQAYHIKCVYSTGTQTVTIGFNVSMLTTAGTIANTGPPPTCLMRIVTHTGQEINSAEIGDNLMLQVDVQPSSIYGGFARSCVAKTMEDSVENEYIVTDENGCATDSTIFGEWDHSPETQSLLAGFNAFKFPSSDNIRFQCNIRVCFGKCQPVNCRGDNAFGRRKREISRNVSEVDIESYNEGQLREEITIQSNAILTFERREERFIDPTEAPEVRQVEDICISMIGFIIALVITALLALVAVAVAVSCWLLAYRRRPKTSGPLPHPPEFPNPLFTTPEPVAEPSPDYLS